MKTKNIRGFTLLELLVVIGIISILMALGAISYALAQAKGRDSRRISDMKSIQSALEQYYANNSFRYPAANCSDASTFIKGVWPTDPYNGLLSGVNYSYGSGVCTTSSYCYCARLEKGNGNSTVTDCTAWSASGGDYYCVANLQ